ncbi:hypothetical protein PHSY_004774 [Pseudozyma hubeiensis SY62]|uniref:THIF-type NAD/FAD binding fold domain-containing protein n=1 Tax=Pseudozyma hubeiensis (strain SY62) TaxID=1305764 RepID=R9P772_PSEHS|nr:hypothetical protein PHSY_004774 [Pseudozyma hubeiensis SY62]GAC97189.1 hypothetical protein PHSY_004774 [Pseudozyma hubeiensis SY62]
MEATTAAVEASTAPLDPPAPPTNGTSVTEDEAALYDRQIRLWGLAAQTRLRSAHILILGWNGIATEIIKNTVLSGIGSVTVVDPTPIDGSVDLLSGFFFRDEEVGLKKCSQGPLDRIRGLNPLVKVTGLSDEESYNKVVGGGEEAVKWLKDRGIDVVVVGTPLTDSASQSTLVRLNETTRSANIKFFFSATLGFGALYFADQISHDYLLERAAPTTSTESTETHRIKKRQAFIPLSTSLSTKWSLTERQQRRLKVPLDWFIWCSLTDLQQRLGSDSSTTSISAEALKDRTIALIAEKGLNPDVLLAQYDAEVFQRVVGAGGMGVALAPVAAVVGGVLSQDILNSVGGREEPVVNWLFLTLDGSGSTVVSRIGELEPALVVD